MTFNATTTAEEVLESVNLSGSRILITGTSAGLGVETARVLAARGASIVGAVRDLEKGRHALESAGVKASSGATIDLVQIDLASLASVRAGADRLLREGKPIDVLIANAGVMATPFGKTVDGFETQFGTNHLGHFVLMNRLAPLLKAPGGRLINVSSAGHRRSDVDLQDPNFDHTEYGEFIAYGRSKTANILFAVEFDRRYRANGIRACAVYPGTIRTEIGRHLTPEAICQLGSGGGYTYKKLQQGAATTVWSAIVAPADEIGAHYCEDCHVASIEDNPDVRSGVRTYALDPDRARALWAESEAMVGECFDPPAAASQGAPLLEAAL